jgi:hypothetical protein
MYVFSTALGGMDVRSLKRTTAALMVAAGIAAPAAGNPVPEPSEPDTGGNVIFFGTVAAVVVTAAAVYLHSRLAGRVDEATSCTFAAEEVTITLSPRTARVRGVYTFCNAGAEDASLAVTYPFAAADGLGAPENVAVCDEAGLAVPFAWFGDEISFDVEVPAGGRADVVVAFEQRCAADRFTYLVTTTREWGRPLERARFIVETSASLGPVASTYPLERVADDGATVKYGFTRENFYPEEELTLSWAPAAVGD